MKILKEQGSHYEVWWTLEWQSISIQFTGCSRFCHKC